MTFDWSEYLKLAQELGGQAVSPASQEARLRSSVNRAYYAAFCQARNYLRNVEGHSIPMSSEVHISVRNEFKSSSDRVRRKIGNNLDRLRIEQRKADYEDLVVGLPSTSRMALALAGQVISALDTLERTRV